VYSLTDLGWNSFFDQQLTDDERSQAVVARVSWEGRGMYRLSPETQTGWLSSQGAFDTALNRVVTSPPWATGS
jgi:hypothetical protein